MKKTGKTTPSALTRREFLGRTGASVTLAAGAALSPFVLSGCGKEGGGDKIKVGILHSLSGTMAISETSLRDVELMAIEEINKAGGLLGKQIEAVVEDPESKFTDVFPEKAKKLLLKDKVVAVFGCWTSVSRQNVKPVFEENNGLLFYPVQYEGNECSKNIVYTGAAPNQQIMPAVDWLVEDIEKRTGKKVKDQKWYLLGTDYVFPRTANLVIVKYLETKGLKIDTDKYEKYTPFNHKDYSTYIKDIVDYDPDVVFSTINGDSNINFYNGLAEKGIKASKTPVCAVSVGEDELRGLDKLDAFKGHLAAWNYYQSVDTPKNKEFVKKFKDKYGKDRVTDDPIEAAYIGVYFWAEAVKKAGSTDVDKVREAFKSNIEFEAPGGKVKLDPETQHTYKPFLMGKIQEDKQFEVVYSTKLIKPEPYPQEVFPGWHCDWTKTGVVKGKDVKIGS